uniref:DNA topoisomerase (ATP-hydrolyzing) n=1 Tax=Lingulaulax polyedra TaxID=160621 RepID=A0A516AG44_LINPO|nr:meiotic recombination protein SPO11 [Lingulodinium polyedra]
MAGMACGIEAAPHVASERPRLAVAAVEALVLRAVRMLAGATRAACPPTAVAALALSDPCHALVAEDGEFCTSTDRKRCLEFVPRSYRRLARLFGALDMVHQLNVSGRSATQRELFYRVAANGDGSLFSKQADMDRAIRDAVGALLIGRPHLGVLTSEKGLVAGALRFCDPCTSAASNATHGTSGVAISEAMLSDDATGLKVESAHCVLVVEKDSFFQHLLQGRLLASLPLVLITGRGYPDVLTRRLLQRLHRTAPHLPQVYLGDYDPHGVSIFLLYRASCPSLQWLGMHEADVRCLPAQASLPLTARDRALQASLLRRPEVRGNDSYASEVRSMSRKFELEAMHAAYSAEEIALHVVPEKILRRAWI